jgi:hypothetical protein
VGFFGVCGQLWGVVVDFRVLQDFLWFLCVFLWVTITYFACKKCGCGWRNVWLACSFCRFFRGRRAEVTRLPQCYLVHGFENASGGLLSRIGWSLPEMLWRGGWLERLRQKEASGWRGVGWNRSGFFAGPSLRVTAGTNNDKGKGKDKCNGGRRRCW